MAEFSRLATGSFKPQDDLLARLTPIQRESPLALKWRKYWVKQRGDFVEYAVLDRQLPYDSETQTEVNAAGEFG